MGTLAEQDDSVWRSPCAYLIIHCHSNICLRQVHQAIDLADLKTACGRLQIILARLSKTRSIPARSPRSELRLRHICHECQTEDRHLPLLPAARAAHTGRLRQMSRDYARSREFVAMSRAGPHIDTGRWLECWVSGGRKERSVPSSLTWRLAFSEWWIAVGRTCRLT